MVIPLILGSMAKSVIEGDVSFESESFIPLLFGFFSAFITGIFACKWMIKLVKKSIKVFQFLLCNSWSGYYSIFHLDEIYTAIDN